jgi:hypothetical protein
LTVPVSSEAARFYYRSFRNFDRLERNPPLDFLRAPPIATVWAVKVREAKAILPELFSQRVDRNADLVARHEVIAALVGALKDRAQSSEIFDDLNRAHPFVDAERFSFT